MFSKINILFSKGLQKLITEKGLLHIDGFLVAIAMPATILSRNPGIHNLSKEKHSRICLASVYEASRIELFLETAGEGDRGLYVFLSLFCRGRNKKLLRAKFHTGGGEVWFVGLEEWA